MPCDRQNNEALHAYRCSLAKVRNIIDRQNINKVILAGDFNADPFKGRFWNELAGFKESL